MGVDPLADGGGQERFSPYAAMGNNPVMMVDPGGMQWTSSASLEPSNMAIPSMMFRPSQLSRMSLNNNLQDDLDKKAFLEIMTKELLATLGFGIGSSGSTFTGITSFGIVCNFGAKGDLNDKDEKNNECTSIYYSRLKDYNKMPLLQQSENSLDCGYYVLSAIDQYYGGGCTPQDFKNLNGGHEGALEEDIICLAQAVGYNAKKTSLNPLKMATDLSNGVASLTGIHMNGINHIVANIAFEIRNCQNIDISGRMFTTMDPGTGSYENYLNPNTTFFIIISKQNTQ